MIGGINRYPSNTFTGERKGASRPTKAPDFENRLAGAVADTEKEMGTFPVSRQDDQSAKEFVSKYQAALEQELSFRSRNPLENTVKEKERHNLFADERRSAFDSKTFLEILGVEPDTEFNWEADGTLAGIFEKIKRDGNGRETPPERQNGLELVSTNVPDTVREAWDRAEAEAGINGAAREADGKLLSITALFAMAMVKWYNEGNTDVLGSTEESAAAAVRKALENLGIPQTEMQKKEKMFYEAFLRYLQPSAING